MAGPQGHLDPLRASSLDWTRAAGMSRVGPGASLTTEAGLYGAIGALLALPYTWMAGQALDLHAPVGRRIRRGVAVTG